MHTGEWVGDCFIYTNNTNRLNYLVGDQTYTISHFDQPMYVLGYLPRDGRVYIADKDVAITSFAVSLNVVEYQTLVLRGDLENANNMLPDISADQKNKIARFLEGQGYKEQALEVATDPEHRFDLSLSLSQLDIALDLARQADVEHKWKTVGDAALSGWDLALAEECFENARDLGSLLLLHSSTGNGGKLRELANKADAVAAHNIAFSALWQLSDVDACLSTLLKTGRTTEAALFAQTYAPSKAPRVVGRWKKELEQSGKGKVAKIIGIPPGTKEAPASSETAEADLLQLEDGEKEGKDIPADSEMFPEWDNWLKLENEGKSAQDTLVDVDGVADGNTNGASTAVAKEEVSKGLQEIEQEAQAEAEADGES